MKLFRLFYDYLAKIVQLIYLRYRCRIYENLYKKRTKATGLSVLSKREGEDEFLKKWKRISKYVSPIDYRLYSQYIGNNPNIVPEFVIRHIIEPVFHPVKYRQFYNDKNMYNKLLPSDCLAKSVFRCIDGVYCGGGV